MSERREPPGNPGEDEAEGERLDPEEAFLLFADETRVRILKALGDAWVEDWPGRRSYSEVMDAVEAEDSGRFNYHLDRLVGRFVSHDGESYKLNFPGLVAYRTVLAGSYTDHVAVGSLSVDAPCPACNGTLDASYGDHLVTVRCADCGRLAMESHVPPRGFAGRSDADVLRAADLTSRHQIELMRRGVCPWCRGRVEASVHGPDSDWAAYGGGDRVAYVALDCAECGGHHGSSVGGALLRHPAVVAHFHEHGVDVAERRVWELPFAATDEHTAAVATDPWRFEVGVECRGERLTLTVDDDLRVVETTRTD